MAEHGNESYPDTEPVVQQTWIGRISKEIWVGKLTSWRRALCFTARLISKGKTMAIVISKEGKNAVRVEKSAFDKEEHLEKYIFDNPESLPLYEIKADIRLLIMARQFPTQSGPIDSLGVDMDGELYVIETKLFKNPDKRIVVAQALDYGAALWKHSNNFNAFIAKLDEYTLKTFNLRAIDKIKEFFQLSDESVEVLLDNMKSNLDDGKFHFVVPMDKLDDRLKDLIIYVNQNSQFDIYAIELEYYKHAEYEIVIPKIFGAEVKKDINVSSSNASRRKWTEREMFDDAKQKLSADEYLAFEKIYKFSKQQATEVRLGTGSYGSFSPIFEALCGKSIFTLSSDKRLAFNFEWIVKDNERTAEIFKAKLEAIGFTFPDNYKTIRPSIMIEGWLSKTDQFLQVISEMIKEKKLG